MAKKDKATDFRFLYLEKVSEQIEKHPERYREKDPTVLTIRIAVSIRDKGIRSVIIDTPTFKACAKELGIKNTYKDWEKWFNS